ncbi:MAG: hypothetical protein K2K83_01585 [Rikenella sp.]|nr:hypothetical protein [Rikenella sp.]
MGGDGFLRGRHPAPGWRDIANGALWRVGRTGFSWTSTIPAGSIDAHRPYFDYDGVYPNSSNLRAHAIQLRCLQE